MDIDEDYNETSKTYTSLFISKLPKTSLELKIIKQKLQLEGDTNHIINWSEIDLCLANGVCK